MAADVLRRRWVNPTAFPLSPGLRLVRDTSLTSLAWATSREPHQKKSEEATEKWRTFLRPTPQVRQRRVECAWQTPKAAATNVQFTRFVSYDESPTWGRRLCQTSSVWTKACCLQLGQGGVGGEGHASDLVARLLIGRAQTLLGMDSPTVHAQFHTDSIIWPLDLQCCDREHAWIWANLRSSISRVWRERTRTYPHLEREFK